MASIASSTLRRGKRPETPAEMPGPELTERLAPPPRLRRRPALVAASVAAVCVGALLAVWAYSSLSTAQSVLAVRTTVHRGELITRDELVTVQVGWTRRCGRCRRVSWGRWWGGGRRWTCRPGPF